MEKLHCNETIKTIKWMLNITGLWPKRNLTKIQTIYIVLNWLMSISLMVIISLEALNQTYDLQVINELLCTAIPYAIYILKIRSVTMKRKQFLEVLDDMDSKLFNENFVTLKEPIRNAIRTSLGLARLFKSLVFGIVIFYAAYPFFDDKNLPIPFSYNLGNYHYVMHAYQVLALSLAGWNISCLDVLFATMMIVTSCQIDVLCIKLSTCVEEVENDIRIGLYKIEDFERLVMNKMKRCVQLHLAIIKFVERLEDIFSATAFFQYTSGMVLLCSMLLQLIYIIEPKSLQFLLDIIFLVGILAQFWMYHWFANDILYKSSQINNSCYECGWYKCSPSFRKMMIILMEKAKKPIGVTALNFTYVSLESLGTIFKWSYSLFALLKIKFSS